MNVSINRRATRVATAFAIGAALLVPAVVAAGEPAMAASCMGHEHAAISPPGSSDEFPGGTKAFVAEVKAIAAELGWTPGAVSAFIAQIHAGSHDDCDAALGG